MRKKLNIDHLLADTWLTVTQLRHGVPAEQGEALYQRCQDLVERVREQLKNADYDSQSIAHISYAQCALLDESVLRRTRADGRMDAGQQTWHRASLQARYFGSHDAGSALHERIHQALRHPIPDENVLTCFQRVLLLGFQGDISKADREKILSELSVMVPPMTLLLPKGLLSVPRRLQSRAPWRSLRLWAVIALLAIAALWWSGQHWLAQLLVEKLPGLS